MSDRIKRQASTKESKVLRAFDHLNHDTLLQEWNVSSIKEAEIIMDQFEPNAAPHIIVGEM